MDKSHGPFGDELTPLMSTNRFVESPPVEGAILSHLSGSTRKGDVHLTFHWVVPSTSTTDEPIYYDPTYDDLDYDKVEPSSTDSMQCNCIADVVETRNTDNDQTADYIDPNDLDQ